MLTVINSSLRNEPGFKTRIRTTVSVLFFFCRQDLWFSLPSISIIQRNGITTIVIWVIIVSNQNMEYKDLSVSTVLSTWVQVQINLTCCNCRVQVTTVWWLHQTRPAVRAKQVHMDPQGHAGQELHPTVQEKKGTVTRQPLALGLSQKLGRPIASILRQLIMWVFSDALLSLVFILLRNRTKKECRLYCQLHVMHAKRSKMTGCVKETETLLQCFAYSAVDTGFIIIYYMD